MGQTMTLKASAVSVSHAPIGTLSRAGGEYILRFSHSRYRVSPIGLSNGLTIAAQTITLAPGGTSTLRIDQHTGAVSSDLHWVVDAPNTLYNGSHTLRFSDIGSPAVPLAAAARSGALQLRDNLSLARHRGAQRLAAVGYAAFGHRGDDRGRPGR